VNAIVRRLVALSAVALALSACKGTDEAALAQAKVELQNRMRLRVTDWIEGHPALCPLAEAEAWLSPLGGVTFSELDKGGAVLEARATIWCRGRSSDGGSSRLSAVVTIPPKGPSALDYGAATLSEIENVGLGRMLLSFLVIPWVFTVVVALVWRSVGIGWTLLVLSFLSDLLFALIPPAVGVVLIAAASLLIGCWWTWAVFHSSWLMLLSPVLFLPMFSMWSAAYLHRVREHRS
jgi:hypothetical protein